MQLYTFGPLLSMLLFKMRRSWFVVFVFSVHSFSHWVFASALICCDRDDFRGLWLNGWRSVGSVAARFASISARSLPSTPWWPGTHTTCNWLCGCCATLPSMRSMMDLMIDCPDCVCGWLIDMPAAWLSVKMWHIGNSSWLFSHCIYNRGYYPRSWAFAMLYSRNRLPPLLVACWKEDKSAEPVVYSVHLACFSPVYIETQSQHRA